MTKIKQNIIAAVTLAALSTFGAQSHAGLIGGDILNVFVPGAGTFEDKIHDRYKKTNPNYGQWEEQFTNDVRSDLGLQPHCQDVYNKYGHHMGCF